MSENQADNLQPTKNRGHSDQLAAEKLRAHSPTPAEVELSDLIAYLDGELDDPSVEAIEQRLVMDGPLRKKAESLDKTWQLLETLEEAEASGEFTQRTLASIAAIPFPSDQGDTEFASPASKLSLASPAWRQAIVLFVSCFGFSWLGLNVAHWRATASVPEAEREMLENLDVLRGYAKYRLIPSVSFLQEIELPNGPANLRDVSAQPLQKSSANDTKGASP